MATVEHKVIAKDMASPVLSKIGSSFLSLQNIAIGAGIAIATKLGKDAVESAMKLETAFAKVKTIGELTEDQMSSLEKTSVKFGKSAVDAAEGLYDIYSAGHKGAEGMDILNVAMKTSVAGFTEVKGAASTIIDVMNAYGDAVGDATRVSEILLKGVELGKYTFEEYAGQIGRVTSLGKQMGVEFTELIAILDVLTIKGIDFSEAITAMRGIMNAMVKPTDALKAIFQEWGYATAQNAIDAEGFIGILQRLYEESNGNMELMGEWIPRVRGLTGFITALSGETDQLTKFQNELANSTGILNEKYQIMADTYEQQMKIFKENIEGVKRDIGEGILPFLSEWIDYLSIILDLYQDIKSILPGGMGEELPSRLIKGILPKEFIDILDAYKRYKEMTAPGPEPYSVALDRQVAHAGRIKTIWSEIFEYERKTYGSIGDFAGRVHEITTDIGIQAATMSDKFLDSASKAAKVWEEGVERTMDLIENVMPKVSMDFGKSLVDILSRVGAVEEQGVKGEKGYIPGHHAATPGNINNLLQGILDRMEMQNYIGDEEKRNIEQGIKLQLEAMRTREHMKDIALQTMKQSEFWSSLTHEEQVALADQLGASMQEYISTTDVILSDIAASIKDLKLNPTINVYVDVGGSGETRVETEVQESGGGAGLTWEEMVSRGIQPT